MDQHYQENPLKPPYPPPNKLKEYKFVVPVISWLNNNEEKVSYCWRIFQIDHTDSNTYFNNSRLVYSLWFFFFFKYV